MDKLKVILAHLKKHHFWVLCLVVLIAGLVGWYSAATAVSNEFKTNVTKVEGVDRDLSNVISGTQANDKSIEQAKEVTKKNRDGVLAAWKTAYNQQTDKVLKWPDSLGEDFIQHVQAVGPAGEIKRAMREKYQNFVNDQFPKLLKIIEAQSQAEMDRAKTAPQPNAIRGVRPAVAAAVTTPQQDYKVIWDTGNQQQIMKRLQFDGVPSTKQVRYTQEDLWVYEALMMIIAKVNEKAEQHYQAPIKRIVDVSIAADAAKQFDEGRKSGRVVRVTTATTTPASQAASTTAAPTIASVPQNGLSSGIDSLDDNRYVDIKGQPLPAGAPMPVEFKNMPVYLQLKMDQRNISDLLLQCAKSPLPIEVRQLRINAGKSSSTPRGGAAQIEKDPDASPFDVTVEVLGIVCIFNKPDEAKIGTSAPLSTTASPEATQPAPSND